MADLRNGRRKSRSSLPCDVSNAAFIQLVITSSWVVKYRPIDLVNSWSPAHHFNGMQH